MHRLLISLCLGLCGSVGILSGAYLVSDLGLNQTDVLPMASSTKTGPLVICESRVC